MKPKAADTVRQFTISEDDDGIRLDRWFKRNLPTIGFATISRWARTGQVRVDGGRVKPEDRLEAGQVLRVPPGGEAPHKKPKARKPLTEEQIAEARAMVIRETPSAIVLNKPPGLATQRPDFPQAQVPGCGCRVAGRKNVRAVQRCPSGPICDALPVWPALALR